jgi:hypothetical protein
VAVVGALLLFALTHKQNRKTIVDVGKRRRPFRGDMIVGGGYATAVKSFQKPDSLNGLADK